MLQSGKMLFYGDIMFAQNLENSLDDAIKSHDLETATSLINLIKKHKAASLFAIDDKRENFLHIALKQRAADIFELLYESIKNEEKGKSLLSKPDSQGNSLFGLALSLDTPSVAITLFNAFEKSYYLDESIKVFFRENKEGNSPLHLAADQDESESLDFILSKIKQANGLSEDDKLNQEKPYIHSAFFVSKNHPKVVKQLEPVDARLIQVNNQGESPLHLTASRGHISNTVHLINAGASPFLKNKKGETALDLLEKSLDEKSLSILPRVFAGLNPETKQDILVYYRNKLLANSENEALKKVYFTLAGMISLVVLSNAHLEFNKKVPIKTGLSAQALFLEEIPDTYRRKVLKDEKEQGIVRAEGEFTPDMKKQLNKEELIDLLIDLESSLEGVKTRCKALDAVPGFKESFNNSGLKKWIDNDENVGATIGISTTVGLTIGMPTALGLALGVGHVLALLIGGWIIPVLIFGPLLGGALLGALAVTLFYAVVKGIDWFCQKPSNNLVALPVSLTDTLNQIEALSSTANWPEEVTGPLERLVGQISAKEVVDADEATVLLNRIHHLIEEFNTVNFSAVDVVKMDLAQKQDVVDKKIDEEEPSLDAVRWAF